MRKLLAPLTTSFLVMFVVLLSMNAGAYAATETVPQDGSWLDLARPVFDSIMSGHYVAASALALVLAVATLKHYANSGSLGKFVHSDAGGVVTTFAMAFFGAVAAATAATGSGWSGFSLEVARVSAFLGLTAIGGYVGIKKLILPVLAPYIAKAPAWVQKAFALVTWAFDRKFAGGAAEAEAKKAGQAAVDAKPGSGVSGVLGSPTDVK